MNEHEPALGAVAVALKMVGGAVPSKGAVELLDGYQYVLSLRRLGFVYRVVVALEAPSEVSVAAADRGSNVEGNWGPR